MFCYHCGKEVGEIDAFCPYCGVKLNNVSAPVESTSSPEQLSPPAADAQKPAKMSALAAVGFGFACVALLLTGVAFAVDGLFSYALVGGIVGLVLSIVGLVLNRKAGNHKVGKGLALAGIVLSAFTLAVVTIAYLLVAIAGVALLAWLLLLLGA